ncbi:MAG: HPr(Ser) kinase/phosphatase, partial [Clostridia bacterium]|nr:HPr(Ser) kinase/phosphatase [Clostridia bacterium]
AIMKFLESKPVAVVISSSLDVFPEFVELGEYFEVPILRTSDTTSAFMAALIAFLNVQLAPRLTRHGVLVEVYGEGVLILGDSGVGKSETAIELVKRGHRLIADDAVEIKRVSAKTLVGSAPEIIRHYVELRGIGIVDVRRIFGMGAVKLTEKIDMIINLEPWVQGKMYDRFGLDSEYTEILGIKIPTTTIPVKPGRNLAIILEIAAMNNRQKKMGFNTAEEFNKKLMGQMGIDTNGV